MVWNVILYFLLAATGGYYCNRCYALVTSVMNQEQAQQYKHRRAYLSVIIVFFVIFTLRFIWCFLYSINANPLQQQIEQVRAALMPRTSFSVYCPATHNSLTRTPRVASSSG